jgi:hypothetical protein
MRLWRCRLRPAPPLSFSRHDPSRHRAASRAATTRTGVVQEAPTTQTDHSGPSTFVAGASYTSVLYGAAMAAHAGRLDDIDLLCGESSGFGPRELLCAGIGCICELIHDASEACDCPAQDIIRILTVNAPATPLGDGVTSIVHAAAALAVDDDVELCRNLYDAEDNPQCFIALATVLSALLAAEADFNGVGTDEWITARCFAAATLDGSGPQG